MQYMEMICGGSACHSLTNHLKTPCEIEWYEGVLHSRNQRRYHLIRHCYYPSPSVPSKCFVRGYDVKFVQSAFDEYTRPPCSCRTACRGNTWTNPWRKFFIHMQIEECWSWSFCFSENIWTIDSHRIQCMVHFSFTYMYHKFVINVGSRYSIYGSYGVGSGIWTHGSSNQQQPWIVGSTGLPIQWIYVMASQPTPLPHICPLKNYKGLINHWFPLIRATNWSLF